jgi:hypothetical protein
METIVRLRASQRGIPENITMPVKASVRNF